MTMRDKGRWDRGEGSVTVIKGPMMASKQDGCLEPSTRHFRRVKTNGKSLRGEGREGGNEVESRSYNSNYEDWQQRLHSGSQVFTSHFLKSPSVMSDGSWVTVKLSWQQGLTTCDSRLEAMTKGPVYMEMDRIAEKGRKGVNDSWIHTSWTRQQNRNQ